MTNPSLTLTAIEDLHRAGRLEEAKQGYLIYCAANPNDITALHSLAILYVEAGELEQAQSLFEKACTLQPDNAVLSLHLANVFKAKGQFSQAEQILLNILQTHPNFSATYNNLGTLYFAQDKWLEALEAYQSAIVLQADYADAYYNLGLTLVKLYRNEEAINVYQALLQLTPQHPGGRFQLGCLLMQQDQYQAALDQFSVIAKAHPFHFETQVNLAACYLKLGWTNEAKAHYSQALTIMPTDCQVLFNLGVINMQQGQTQDAIQLYIRAIQSNIDFFEAQNNLGVAYLAIQDRENAARHFHEALRIQPGNQAVQHTINILMREKNLSVSPPEYVRNLFDSYAGHYDLHLTRSLRYQVPQLLLQAVQTVTDLSTACLDILDLGCGTGLCGELFKPVARSLVGVDISANMLTVARQKNIYDDLIQADILPFLANGDVLHHENIAGPATYDLILAGDVLEYYGDLDEVFSNIYRTLRPHGWFVFNTEISLDKAYEMTESGRFAHTQKYIDDLAVKYELDILQHSVVTLRTQNDEPVRGYLYVLRR